MSLNNHEFTMKDCIEDLIDHICNRGESDEQLIAQKLWKNCFNGLRRDIEDFTFHIDRTISETLHEFSEEIAEQLSEKYRKHFWCKWDNVEEVFGVNHGDKFIYKTADIYRIGAIEHIDGNYELKDCCTNKIVIPDYVAALPEVFQDCKGI